MPVTIPIVRTMTAKRRDTASGETFIFGSAGIALAPIVTRRDNFHRCSSRMSQTRPEAHPASRRSVTGLRKPRKTRKTRFVVSARRKTQQSDRKEKPRKNPVCDHARYHMYGGMIECGP